jgi:putative zinc finger/helix-turn-helix YgiT family protein
MKGICPNCERETNIEPIHKKETVMVSGESIEIEVDLLKCLDCGEEFEDPQNKSDSLDKAYREYRRRHSMLNPEEIQEFRKRYGLTQGEMSRLLAWGGATLSRYENGALQDGTHEKALRLAMEPRNLLALIESTPDALPHAKRERLINELRAQEQEAYSLSRVYEERFGRYDADIMSGYRNLDLAKLYNAVLFFCRGGIFKTVLNKLLFYADFLHFKEYSVSITGARYVHVPFGPAPDNYAHYFATLVDDGMLSIEEVEYDKGISGEKYTAEKKPDLNIFSDSELKVLTSVKDKYGKLSATAISKRSHKEKGYLETTNSNLISYAYAEVIE